MLGFLHFAKMHKKEKNALFLVGPHVAGVFQYIFRKVSVFFMELRSFALQNKETLDRSYSVKKQ